MLREAQLSTRNMVNAVTEEFWKMVRESIDDQALHFKSEGNFYIILSAQLCSKQQYARDVQGYVVTVMVM